MHSRHRFVDSIFIGINIQCAENHGMFVRPIQLKLLDDAGNVMDPTSLSSVVVDDGGAARARLRLTR